MITRLHVQADEENGRRPLLLVHGFLSSRRHWLPNGGLSDTFRLIRVDLPAHGLSPAPASGLLADLVASLDEVRDRLGISRWHVCGQSFGAGLTLRYALNFPDRTIAQVFTNANGAVREAWSEARSREHEAAIRAVEKYGHAGLRGLPFHPAHARRFPDDIRRILTADADAIDIPGILTLMRDAVPNLSLRQEVSATTCPTLLVNGIHERRFQPARAWLQSAVPGLVVVDLPGGHSINIEQPAGFDAAVRTFLSRFG